MFWNWFLWQLVVDLDVEEAGLGLLSGFYIARFVAPGHSIPWYLRKVAEIVESLKPSLILS